jgi:hypothetical protein
MDDKTQIDPALPASRSPRHQERAMSKLQHAMRSQENPVVLPAKLPLRPASEEQPLRLLLIRLRPGEVPWSARAMADMMAPAVIVQVVGMGNALWRLGHERFDTVLLDPELADQRVIRRCREQIADIAAVPVLDLADPPAAAAAPQARPVARSQRGVAEAAVRETERQTLRLPWQRRSKRPGVVPQAVASVG